MTDLSSAVDDVPRQGAGFWIGLVLGAPVVGSGVRGVLDALPGVQLTSFLRWFVGGAILHDLLVAPLVCLMAWGVVRIVPAVAAGPVQGALLASGVVGLVSWPFVRGYGITPGEPSFLSLDYAASVLVIWAAIWLIAAVAILWRSFNARRR